MGFLVLSILNLIIPVALLLTVCFFVVFALRKVDTQGLKIFGNCVLVLLALSTILVLVVGVMSAIMDRKQTVSREAMIKSQLSKVAAQNAVVK
jgi:hypothetical protein